MNALFYVPSHLTVSADQAQALYRDTAYDFGFKDCREVPERDLQRKRYDADGCMTLLAVTHTDDGTSAVFLMDGRVFLRIHRGFADNWSVTVSPYFNMPAQVRVVVDDAKLLEPLALAA